MKRKNYFKQIFATLALAGVMFFGSAPSANAALLPDLLDFVGRVVGDIVGPPPPPTSSSFLSTVSFRADASPTHNGLNKPAVASIAEAD